MSLALPRTESAELAREQANVRIVDVAVMNVGRNIAVEAVADHVRDRPDPVEVAAGVERERVAVGNPPTGLNRFGNRQQLRGKETVIQWHVFNYQAGA